MSLCRTELAVSRVFAQNYFFPCALHYLMYSDSASNTLLFGETLQGVAKNVCLGDLCCVVERQPGCRMCPISAETGQWSRKVTRLREDTCSNQRIFSKSTLFLTETSMSRFWKFKGSFPPPRHTQKSWSQSWYILLHKNHLLIPCAIESWKYHFSSFNTNFWLCPLKKYSSRPL